MAGDFQTIDVPGHGPVDFPSSMSDAEIVAAIKKNSMNVIPEKPDFGAMTKLNSWGNQALAAIPDSLLNTPQNLVNLAKAGYGSLTAAAGRPDLSPDITPAPNVVTNLFKRLGFINPDAEPTTTSGRLAKAGLQGLVGGMIAPASSLPQMAANVGVSGLSNLVGQGTTEATGNPNYGMMANIATTPAVGMMMAKVKANAEATQARNEVRDQTLEAGRNAGYVIPPSAGGGSWFSNRLEGIAGKAATGQESAVRNQKVTNDLAAKEVGLPKNTAITEGKLETRRNELAAPYREAAAIDKSVAADLESLKQTRFDAKTYWQHYQRTADPQSLATAKTLDAKAQLLEGTIEDAAKNSGRPGLVKDLRAARQAIAKTYNVEKALNVGTGDVSASTLGRMLDSGAPLSGNLKTIGMMQQAFPAFMREGARVPAPGVSKGEAIASLFAGLGGHAALGPYGMLLAAAPLLSSPMRSLVLSKPYQSMMLTPSYSGANLPTLQEPALNALLMPGLQGALSQ